MLTLPQATALGPLEHALMRIVWAHSEPITVKHVHATLSADRDVAYTTVMTTMVRLAEKGILIRSDARTGFGGAYHYVPALSRTALLRTAVEQLLTSLGADAAERQHLAAAVQQSVW